MDTNHMRDATGELDPRHWPLVGRDDELALAEAALARHRCVVLSGDAGVGKTRLAREVLHRAAGRDGRTDWVVATRSAATVPLGALAHLVTETTLGRDRDLTLGSMVSALVSAPDGALYLGVDDAHLLDDASAALIQLLVARGPVSVVATVRSGEPAPDPIVSLWKDGPAPLLELQALSLPEVNALVTEVLDGSVDGATLHDLWESSRGNALFLRELILHGAESGALARSHGIWSWSRSSEGVRIGERLYTLVSARMGSVSNDERNALELVATGQPLSLAALDALGVAHLIPGLERRGLVMADPVRPDVVSVAHPLFGEVLRDRMPATRRGSVLLELADAVELVGTGTPSDTSRVVVWRVEAGDHSRHGQIVAAANRALHLWDVELAERLARAALESGPDLEASTVLGTALSEQNRAEDALEVFRSARDLVGPDDIRAVAALAEADLLSHQLGRLDDAERLLDLVQLDLTDERARASVNGGRAVLMISGGRAAAVHDVPTDSPSSALANALDDAIAGRLDQARRTAAEALSTRTQRFDDNAVIALYLELIHVWVLALSGEHARAAADADAAYQRAVDQRAELPTLTWSFARGWVMLRQGRPVTATRALAEAAAGLERSDRGFLRAAHTYLAMAAALRADPTSAAWHLRSAERASAGYEALFGIDLQRARSWVEASRGIMTSAVTEARQAADDARSKGAAVHEVAALHDVVRFGGAADVVRRLDELADVVDGPFVRAVVAHAHGCAERDGEVLEGAASSFEALTLDLFAAEAAATAAAVHRASGRRARAYAAQARSHELAARCELARTPVLASNDATDLLTDRERDVANLATTGLSSRLISEELHISVRTVDNLLGRIYSKLGVTGRKELGAVFDDAPRD